MASLLVYLLFPLLCQGATLHREDDWTEAPGGPPSSACPTGGEAGNCTALRATLHLLKAASTSYECPACNCEKGEAEETCVSYLTGVLRSCRDQAHLGDCLGKELASGFPAGMVPCSTDAAVCTAIHHFTKTVAKTVELACPLPTNTGRQGRQLFTDEAGCLHICLPNGGCEVRHRGSRGQCLPEKFGGFCIGIPSRCSRCSGCRDRTVNDDDDDDDDDEECRYSCRSNGGCRVRRGGSMGSCFPKRFGGSCSGTPSGCRDCNEVRNCDDDDEDDEECRYSCRSNGGCRVRRGGSMGSCFPKRFGGSCSGTPSGCRDCNKVRNCDDDDDDDDEERPRGRCRYSCRRNGSCRVRRGGFMGSCFSWEFGGRCSGTPRGCRDCNEVRNC